MTILEPLQALAAAFPYQWTLPPNLSLGVLTTNEAFKQAKASGLTPSAKALEIAQEIQEFLNKKQLPFKVSTVGPYVNLTPTTTVLNKLLREGLTYSLEQKNDRILLDFFSPNVGKQMHIGHMRSANVGESLRRLFALRYPEIITDNHIADCGIQFAILIWGVSNLSKLSVGFQKIDFAGVEDEIINQLNAVYVAANAKIQAEPEIREQAQALAAKLEAAIAKNETSRLTKEFTLIREIVEINNRVFSAGESYLDLNNWQNPLSPITAELAAQLERQPGVWGVNSTHRTGEFDLILGESYYQQFLGEFEFWAEAGLITREDKGYYVDLEEEGLGRAYLVSSAGYSVYTGRDVLARIIWAGLFGATRMITVADNRQSHSFKQTFAVLKRIAYSQVYAKRPFASLTPEQTKQALTVLQKDSLEHVGFGFISLPSGVMSARKGTVVKFHEFSAALEEQVDTVLRAKNPQAKRGIAYNQKVQQIAAATIKWFDLSRDKDQDIVFNAEEMLSFEGNTGVYQLYTYARICNILQRVETTAPLDSESILTLNEREREILLEAYTLAYTLEQAIDRLRPHLVATHIYSLTAKINSWYTTHSVSLEENPARRDALLGWLRTLKAHLGFCLELLGITPLEKV